MSEPGLWQPTVDRQVLLSLSTWLATIRQHFNETGAIEVITPYLSSSGNLDPAIASVAVPTPDGPRFLHTSPEYPMKRLLAAGTGDCYQICRVFRANESGRRHNPEFTMLEWYRVGIDHHALIEEVDQLFRKLWLVARGSSLPPTEHASYVALTEECCGCAFNDINAERVAQTLQRESVSVPDSLRFDTNDDLNEWFDLLFSTVIAPRFPRDRLTCVQDYPAEQAALAKTTLNAHGVPVAERFEFFFGELELANGYNELQSSEEHRRRFTQNVQDRQRNDQPILPLDERFMAAIESGLPDCAGVAVGIERLFMVLAEESDIRRVMTFSSDCA